jgi:rubredoxin
MKFEDSISKCKMFFKIPKESFTKLCSLKKKKFSKISTFSQTI